MRGLVAILAVPPLVACVVGFLWSGATVVPPSAGLGLLLGSAAVGVVAPRRLGWFPIWLPPLVMAAVIAVAGQITLLGSRPTPARELTMLVANLTATAPAQLGSVLIVAALIGWRRHRHRRRTQPSV